jgi:nicotinate-nucleotide--dimethylbenzimidazole phosphoribosyltransferase
VLARHLGATLEVINLGTVVDTGPLPGVRSLNLGPGTANFATGAAMSVEQLTRALHAGREAALRAQHANAQLFIGGEMGIGNTTSAATLACMLLDAPPVLLAGPGTGLDSQGVSRKATVIRNAITLHRVPGLDVIETLRRVGGFEIAALAGSYVACAQLGLPVLIDGFIATAAALVATRLHPGCDVWFVYAHASAEPGHACILEALKARPLLDLGMRLGEGSGAAVAVPTLRLACLLHNEMATFAEAGVSEKSV